MNMEEEIIRKVGRILLVTAVLLILTLTVTVVGAKLWFWHQVDAEVAYQKDRMGQTAFGDIVSRTEARFIQGWLMSARVDIYVFHPTEKVKQVSVNVTVAGELVPERSYHAQVTGEGHNTVWSAWIKNSEAAQ